MTVAIIFGIILLNFLLLVTHHAPKAILLTWIPGRIITLICMQLQKSDFKEWIKITWASSLMSVAFLAAFHLSIRCILGSGRNPRFSCAKTEWAISWFIAIFFIVSTTLLCFFVESSWAYFVIGLVAFCLNIVNLMDAPKRLMADGFAFTWTYILGTNVTAIAVLWTIEELINKGYTKWAGLAGAIPLYAAAMIAGSSCGNTPESIKQTNQHIYLLAYQTWPAMTTVGAIWLLDAYSQSVQMIGATAACLVTLALQFFTIKTKI